jgi:hypothetical protein
VAELRTHDVPVGTAGATLGTLETRRQPWALVVGLAVSVRTDPRFMRNLDFAVAVADDIAAEVQV